MNDWDFALTESYYDSGPTSFEARCRHCGQHVGGGTGGQSKERALEQARDSGHWCTQLEHIELLRQIRDLLAPPGISL